MQADLVCFWVFVNTRVIVIEGKWSLAIVKWWMPWIDELLLCFWCIGWIIAWMNLSAC